MPTGTSWMGSLDMLRPGRGCLGALRRLALDGLSGCALPGLPYGAFHVLALDGLFFLWLVCYSTLAACEAPAFERLFGRARSAASTRDAAVTRRRAAPTSTHR